MPNRKYSVNCVCIQ